MISRARNEERYLPKRFRRILGGLTALLIAAILVFIGIAVARTGPYQSKPRILNKPSIVPADQRPSHIVVYVIDALRPDNLDVYGYERETAPAIRRLVNNGALYTRCFANTTWTLDSVRGLFIGMPGAMYSRSRHSSTVSESLEILPERFQDADWATGLVTENVHVTETYGLAQGFDYVGNSSAILGTSDDVAESVLKMSEATHSHLKEFVRHYKDEKFFLYVHTMETHGPIVIPDTIEPFYAEGTTPKEDLVGWYDTAIRWADQRLSVFVELLKSEGLFDDTLLIIAADHGESLTPGKASGTHRGPPLIERVRIPLIVSWPKVVESKTVFSDNVQLLDLGPTILEAAGIPRTTQYRGTSLARLMTQGTDQSLANRPIFTAGEHMNGWGVVQGQWYLFSSRGTKQLLDLSQTADPNEDRSDGNQELVQHLSRLADSHFSTEQRLFAEFQSSHQPTLLGSLKKTFGWRETPKAQSAEPEMDEEHRRALDALGYLD